MLSVKIEITMKTLLSAAFIASLLLAPISTLAQQRTTFADTKLYEAVLGRLFWHDGSNSRKNVLELRYTYCDSGEMQIVVSELNDGRLSIAIWRVPSGNSTVWNQLAGLSNKKSELTPEEVASSIVLKHDSREIEKSAELAKTILAGRELQIPLVGDNQVFLEGSQYELTITSPSRDISLIIRGPQHSASASNAIVRWMGQVRDQVEKLAQVTGHN